MGLGVHHYTSFGIICLLLGVQGCSVLDELAQHSYRTARAEFSFKYEEQEKWKEQFPTFCAGMQQSPININLGNCTQLPAGSAELSFMNWGKIPSKTTVRKTVDTVQLWNEFSGAKPMITGGPLGSDKFELYQTHFHWGPTGCDGSEHWFEDEQYAMEVHIIFVNQKYPTIDEALLNKDGLSVIGRFYEATPNAQPPVFARYLKNLLVSSEVVARCGIPLSKISPTINFDYVSYKGSLTVPNCREVVTWIVGIDKNLEISDRTIDRFRRLVQEASVVRAVQPINGRALTCRIK